MAETIKIGGELESTATGNKVVDVANVKDKTQGDKSQAQINAEFGTALENRYTKSETYNKTELNNMITTPNQQYVSVTANSQTTTVTDVLPVTGAADTIYRVGNWDGSQYNDSVYSEYVWNGSQYIHLSTKTQMGEVFDISAYHTTGGTVATYADLAAALDSNSGGGIPQSLQNGGVSVKFVRTIDNKYVQYRLMSDEWSADTEDWAIADEGVYVENPEFVYIKTDCEDKILYGVKTDGEFFFGAGCPQQVKDYIEEKISLLSLDEYEDIVAFLSDYLGSDTTLKVMIDNINAQIVTKLDAEGLDPEALGTEAAVDNPEWLQVTTDSEDKILEGITPEGVKKINLPIDTLSATFEHVENPEWISVTTDKEGKILEGRNSNGKAIEYVGIETPNIEAEVLNVEKHIELSDAARKQLATALELNSVVTRNKDKEPALLAACRYRSISADAHSYNPLQKDFQISMITDTHSNSASILNAIKVTDAFRSIDAIIHCGDIEIFSPRETSNDYVGNVVEMFNSNLQSKPWFLVCGNHDVGVTRYIHFIRTHEEVYNDFVKPLIDNGTLKNDEYNVLPANPSDEDYKDSCYYFHDFDDRQVRLIVLYEYAWNLVLEDENPYWEAVSYNSSYSMMQKNTTYTYDANNPIILNCGGWKANSFRLKQTVTTVNDPTDDRTGKTFPCVKSRSCRFFNLNQINWLASVLNSTPNGYGIVIATHIPAPSAFGTLMTDKNFCMRGYDFNGGSIDVNSNVPILLEIVNAWINKTSISERVKYTNNAYCAYNGFDVEYENVLGSDDDTYAYEVNLDFSSRSNNNSYFGGYLGGHVHYDLVVKATDYSNQICIVECCGFPQYRGSADLPNMEDSDNLAFDNITVFSCSKNRIALARIGNTKTTDGRTRDFEIININQ